MNMIQRPGTNLSRVLQVKELKPFINEFKSQSIIRKDDFVNHVMRFKDQIPTLIKPSECGTRMAIVCAMLRIPGIKPHTRTKGTIITISVDWDEYDKEDHHEF